MILSFFQGEGFDNRAYYFWDRIIFEIYELVSCCFQIFRLQVSPWAVDYLATLKV